MDIKDLKRRAGINEWDDDPVEEIQPREWLERNPEMAKMAMPIAEQVQRACEQMATGTAADATTPSTDAYGNVITAGDLMEAVVAHLEYALERGVA